MTQIKPNKKGFFDEFFEDLEKKYKSPNPAAISEGTEKFESMLTGTILPFIGLNAFGVGCLFLWDFEPELRFILPIVTLLAAVIILVRFEMMRMNRLYRGKYHGFFVGMALTYLQFTIISIPYTLAGNAVFLLISYFFAFTVFKGRLPQKSCAVLVIYIPLLIFFFRPHSTTERMLLEALALLPIFVLFFVGKLPTAMIFTLLSTVITGAIEFSQEGGHQLGLIFLLASFVVIAIIYELRIPKDQHSDLRDFSGLGPLILLIYFLINVVYSMYHIAAIHHVWVWAGSVSLYQIFELFRERSPRPSRLAWIAVSLSLAAWASDVFENWHHQVIMILLIASVLHLAALWIKNKFISDTSVIISVLCIIPVVRHCTKGLSPALVIVGLVCATQLLLLSQRGKMTALFPWWTGFVVGRHLQWAKKIVLIVFGTLSRIPFLSLIFSWLRTAFLWLRYFKGDEDKFGSNDVLFVTGHGLAVYVLTVQISILLGHLDVSILVHRIWPTVIWAFWGTGITLNGIRSGSYFRRLVGICFIISPILFEILKWHEEDRVLYAWLAVVVGLSFWLIGLFFRRTRIADAESDQQLTVKE